MERYISVDRILSKLDEHLGRNDYSSAERHLKYWLSEATASRDLKAEIAVRNELMGLYRKLGRKKEALDAAKSALDLVANEQISYQVGGATTLINAATVYKAFGKAADAIELFEQAKQIYERELSENDGRLGGLYNNMALAMVDLERYDCARDLYAKAIEVMKKTDGGELEIAITYLNLASAAESELGLLEADEYICECMDVAASLIDGEEKRDGYYAFVCEKCASVFGYYGRFVYENELKERARRIYEGT